MKTKVLAFLDNDTGRDVELMLPVLYFAKKYLNCEIQLAFVYDYHAIYRYKPDVVAVPNTIGSQMYIIACQYAKEQGIPIFALESEGNFRTDGKFNHWGLNYEKRHYQEYVCCWSKRAQEYYLSVIKENQEKFVVTGGTGFDRYTLFNFLSKDEFLNKHHYKNYSQIVTYAGWAFGKLYNPKGVEQLTEWLDGNSSKLALIEQQRKDIESILRYAIENNPDTLFILKQHPKEFFQTETDVRRLNEITELSNYPNVHYTIEENIHDLINVSDLVLGFESTTAIEAWLLNTPTALIRTIPNINPVTLEEKGYHLAQPTTTTGEQLDSYLKELSKTGYIADFNTPPFNSKRKEVIIESIGFSDGMCHIRANYYLKQTIKKATETYSDRKYKINLKHYIMYRLILLGKLFFHKKLYSLFPKTRKFIWVFEQYSLKKTHDLLHKYAPQLDSFYAKNNIQERLDKGLLFKELLDDAT